MSDDPEMRIAKARCSCAPVGVRYGPPTSDGGRHRCSSLLCLALRLSGWSVSCRGLPSAEAPGSGSVARPDVVCRRAPVPPRERNRLEMGGRRPGRPRRRLRGQHRRKSGLDRTGASARRCGRRVPRAGRSRAPAALDSAVVDACLVFGRPPGAVQHDCLRPLPRPGKRQHRLHGRGSGSGSAATCWPARSRRSGSARSA